MPREPDSLDAGDILTDAVMSVLAESGATGFSLRALATARGGSVGALTNRFGSRDRMLHIAINYFRHRWNTDMGARVWSEGALALLPLSDDEVEDCRVWFAFCELARANAVLTLCVADQREEERGLVQMVTRGRGDEATIDVLLALIHGLRVAICTPDSLSVAAARTLLGAHLERQGLAGPPDPLRDVG